jgi:hypothetical protein
VDFAGEAEIAEVFEKVVVKSPGALEPIDVGGREAKILKKIERLMQSGGEQEAAPRRQAADEEFEHCRIGVAMIQISLDHVDLIKIGQQRTDGGFQCGSPFSVTMISPNGEGTYCGVRHANNQVEPDR